MWRATTFSKTKATIAPHEPAWPAGRDLGGRLLGSLAAAVTLVGERVQAAEPPSPQPFHALVQQHLDDYILANHIAGVAAGVAYHGHYYPFTAGVRNRDTQAPVTTETLFPVGSVTKIFTGIMLAHLVQEGAVGLEDPVVHYLPAEIGRAGGAIRQVTLLDLATHTSGMTDGAPGNPAEQVYFDLPPLPNLVRDWIRWSPTPPNTGDPYLYHYSNKGYLTLAFAVAQAGQRGGYNPLFQEVFRDPLGLRYLQTLGTMTPTFRALLTSSYGDREDPKDKVGNGVNANLLDLEPFLQACLLNQGTPPRLRQAIEFSQRPFRSKLQSDSRQRMGLGWDLSLAPPLTISKGGATAGAFSHLQLQPQENVGVMVMANGKPSTGNDIGRVAADLMALVQRHGDRELARGRPTRHSSGTGRSRPNDGHKTGATVWAAAGPEDWWEVDLESLQSVGYLHVLTAWDGTNAYPYRIHTSLDRLAWTLAVDATQPPEPATLAGDRHRIPPRLARHVRVQSAGAPLRLVEVEVFEHPDRAAAALWFAQPKLEVIRNADPQPDGIEYSYRRLASENRLDYAVSVSENLRDWERLGAEWGAPIVQLEPSGLSEKVSWRAGNALRARAGSVYLRLVISHR
ncbi:MAG: serine hydrolase [Verrucomicrobiales bacterium]|nr:serine hydrolase [Verrucomicrobiales bacterium]